MDKRIQTNIEYYHEQGYHQCNLSVHCPICRGIKANKKK